MADRVPLSQHYREARESLTALVLAHPEADELPVPATPGWTVHDVVAHLTGVAEDVAGGWEPRPPTPEWTAGHVARGVGVPTGVLLKRWEECGPTVEPVVDLPVWPFLMDVLAHEYDVRAALGDRSGRDNPVVPLVAKVLLRSLQAPAPLVVETESGSVRLGPDGGEPVTLRTTDFEAFRWRLGRRSPRQLAAMDWSGDPEPFLASLCIFGPAEADVVD